jgi:hypothetical protein
MMVSGNVIKEDGLLNYLLVEGPDDAQVFFHLLRHYRLEKYINIEKKEGVRQLLDELDVELDRSGLGRLGIVVDADVDIAARWQSLRDRLIKLGYSAIPSDPKAEGTILEQEERPVVGIWLMPDNTVAGMLEHFVGFLVRPSDSLWPMGEDIVQKVIEKDCRFPLAQTIKAHIHTWLAWQKEPGKPMGQAITKEYFDAAAPHAQQLIRWIRRLFDLETV